LRLFYFERTGRCGFRRRTPGSTILLDLARKTGEAAALNLSSAPIVQLGLALV